MNYCYHKGKAFPVLSKGAWKRDDVILLERKKEITKDLAMLFPVAERDKIINPKEKKKVAPKLTEKQRKRLIKIKQHKNMMRSSSDPMILAYMMKNKKKLINYLNSIEETKHKADTLANDLLPKVNSVSKVTRNDTGFGKIKSTKTMSFAPGGIFLTNNHFRDFSSISSNIQNSPVKCRSRRSMKH